MRYFSSTRQVNKLVAMDAAAAVNASDITNMEDGSTTFSGGRKESLNAGTAPTGITATEFGDGYHHTTVLVLSDFVIGAPSAGNSLGIGAKVYEFPAGAHVHLVSYFNLGLTAGTVTSDTPDVGLGSVVASGAVSVLSGTATFEDYITGQTWGVALDGTEQATTPLGATAGILTGISLNAADDEKSLYLNAADAWNAGVTGNLTASGRIVLVWNTLY
jgi:hypothetical protein